MTDDRALLRVSDGERENGAERLRQAFADGRIDHEELDERLTATYAARTRADLDAVVADLPGGEIQPATPAAVTPITDRLDIERAHSSYRRSGPWSVPQLIVITVAHGNVRLDFTEAHFGSDPVRIDVDAAHSNVSLRLPDGASVDSGEVASRHGNVSIRVPEAGGRPHLIVEGELRHSNLRARVPRKARRR